jgi:two-component system cell cycle sensor histidine kinase/response regulator CckA
MNAMDALERLTAALVHADPQAGLSAALSVAAELGIVANEADQIPWTTLTHGAQIMALRAVRELPGEATLWRRLLQAAFARACEHERLLRLAERTELLSAASFEGLFFHVDGRVIDVNQRLTELSGHRREDLLGDQVMQRCIVPEELPGVLQRMAERYEGEYVITAMRSDGSRFRAELQAKQGTLGDRPVRVVAVRDVTERERAERERRDLERAFEQSQRLESLGVLAGGIAHDFNNLLTVVLGHAELLQHTSRESREQALLQGIVDAAQRAAALTTQMLAYAGRSELGPRSPVDISALVQELRALLDAALSKKASISLVLSPSALVLGNRATLTQVVMNLLTNASDALAGEAGSIEIRTSLISQPHARWSRSLGNTVTEGNFVLLEVTDTGIGMDESTKARVFEPFFTTKAKGHGLGLAACVGIVSSHGGAILVESGLGVGTTFSVLLPSYTKQTSSEVTARKTQRVHAQRVLVVDDEPRVRANLRSALTMQGYEVSEAENGQRALELLEECSPSVVLLDMTMPDLSGIDVLRRIRERGSRVPVVFSSGYHDAAVSLPPGSFQGFLVKPYRLQELFDVLTRALNA